LYYQLPPDITPEEILEYLRKSRSDDATLTVEEVLEKHERQLDEWAERKLGRQIPEQNKFREIGSGESIESRSEIKKILKMIESPKVKGVLVKEVSRLGRPSLKEIGLLSELFQYSNTLIITPERIFDLRNKYDKDAFEREMMRSNEYLEYFKEIQQNGRLASVSAGNFIGSIPPYGFDKIWVTEGKKKCPTLQIKEDEANIVRMIFDMFVNQNIGVNNIANKLDEMHIKPPRKKYWAADTIRDMLKNEHYIGKVRWNWRKTITIVENGEVKKKRPTQKIGEYLVYDGKHKPIVTEELFNAAVEKLGNNPRTKPNAKLRNPLAGILYCRCGRTMSMRTYKDKDGGERSAPRYLCDDQIHCGTGSCVCSEILDRVCVILEECIEDFEIRLKNDTGNSAKLHTQLIKNLEKQIEDIKARELSQWEQQSHPDPSQRMPAEIFKMLNEKLLKEKEEVQQALCKAYESMPEPVDYEEKVVKFKDALEALKNPDVDVEKKNNLLKACIERIDYTREKPQRMKSQQTRYYDKELKKTRHTSPLKTGGNWTSAPIELDVKLKV
jgi:DNA invertase Pin-like site-specific DNA recombinase